MYSMTLIIRIPLDFRVNLVVDFGGVFEEGTLIILHMHSAHLRIAQVTSPFQSVFLRSL